MSRNRLIAKHLVVGALGGLVLGGLVWKLIIDRNGGEWYLLSYLTGISVVTFLYYGFDKWRAKNGASRVPEASLHGLSILGGTLGAYVGMLWFRHKTIKGSFRILFWGIVVLQAALIAVVIKHLAG